MFTGIVEEIGVLKDKRLLASGMHLSITASKVLGDVRLGDSIAVNGVCLTVTKWQANEFECDCAIETLRQTNFKEFPRGKKLHLERAMPANGRFGGHMVTGHVDGVGVVTHLQTEGIATQVQIRVPKELHRHIIKKGSIAIDGVSLTVAEVLPGGLRISLIPHTNQVTCLSDLRVGQKVHLETDCMVKYTDHLTNYDCNKEDTCLHPLKMR